MRFFLILLIAKAVAKVSRFFSLGTGITWSGEIALRLDKSILSKLVNKIRHGVIIVAGTNGKTTTCAIISHILSKQNKKIISNITGANLENGIVGTLISKTNLRGGIDADYAIFELDEASLVNILKIVKPKILLLLNLFRDQLDRYGEVDTIAQNWNKTIMPLVKFQTKLVVNADDPLMAFLGLSYQGESKFFGLNDKKHDQKTLSHASDSIYCLWCGGKLKYESIFLAHYGNWSCPNCKRKRPVIENIEGYQLLKGVHSLYNLKAAILAVRSLGLPVYNIKSALNSFQPAFGRQEEFSIGGKKIKIFLSKNPAGFNESIRTVTNEKDFSTCLIALNDRIPDGRDVSWIWDVDFENLAKYNNTVYLSGDRVDDLAVRLKYAQIRNVKMIHNLKTAISSALNSIKIGETIYILPTYSAMLDVRKVLTGHRIL